ncbi:hypothetical protein BDV96DRAFT_561749 [Lophiotrema nucula]|uniref:Uncharacterized protein n=1 Tax=Lophiotrema nucula TaxID=690887 RepID=A0A6A5ZV54_9PLEO|nr:hypothetical protein BDV96DRAFT_561749 [Lophiotrema nucula]
MPALVARQWHILRVSRCSAPAWAARRSIAYAVKKQHSAILIPSSPATVQPGDLIPHVAPAHAPASTRYPVIFVTPAFATWLQDPHVFLKPALEKLYKQLLIHGHGHKVHALAAVVDKLPIPQALADPNVVQHEALRRSLHPPTSDTGHEGVAYALLRQTEMFDERRDEEGSVGQGKIDFVSWGSNKKMGQTGYADTLQLPLANTVFQTGSPFTMFKSTWVVDPNRKHELVMESKTNLKRVGLSIHPAFHGAQSVSALSIPLIPLTYPRLVTEGMGNILRRVRGPDQVDLQASHELEQAVPQYFEARNQAAQAIAVWALVTPAEIVPNMARLAAELVEGEDRPRVSAPATFTSPIDIWKAFWRGNPPKWNDLVPSALARGARLHRVLSGGGGWGNKAGLLALDPSFHGDELSFSPPTTEASEEPQDLGSAIHRIVRSQDAVQFFASPTPPEPASTSYEANSIALEKLSTSTHPTWRWELGMIPSTADTLQNTSWQYASNTSTSAQGDHIFVLPNSFGALSERGLTLKSETRENNKSPYVPSGGTTVDVPFSRFSAVLMEELDEKEAGSGKEDTNRLGVAEERAKSIKTMDGEGNKPAQDIEEERNRSDAIYVPSQANGKIEVDGSDPGQQDSGPAIYKYSASSSSMCMRAFLDYSLGRAKKSVHRLESELKDVLQALSVSVPNTASSEPTTTSASEATNNGEKPKSRMSTLINFWDKRMRKVRRSIEDLAQEVNEVLTIIEDAQAAMTRFPELESGEDLMRDAVEDLKGVVGAVVASKDIPQYRRIIRVQSSSLIEESAQKENPQQVRISRVTSTPIEKRAEGEDPQLLRIIRVSSSLNQEREEEYHPRPIRIKTYAASDSSMPESLFVCIQLKRELKARKEILYAFELLVARMLRRNLHDKIRALDRLCNESDEALYLHQAEAHQIIDRVHDAVLSDLQRLTNMIETRFETPIEEFRETVQRISDRIALAQTPNNIIQQADNITTTLTILHTALRWVLAIMIIRRQSQKRQLPFTRSRTGPLQNLLIRLRVLPKSEKERFHLDALERRNPRFKDLVIGKWRRGWEMKMRARMHGSEEPESEMAQMGLDEGWRSRIEYSHEEHRARRRRGTVGKRRNIVRFHATGASKTSMVRKHMGHRVRRIRQGSLPPPSPDHPSETHESSRILDPFGRPLSVPLVKSNEVRIRSFAHGSPKRREKRQEAIRRKEEGERQKEMRTVMGAVEGWLKGF